MYEPSRVIVSLKPEHLDLFLKEAHDQNIPAAAIGETGGGHMIIEHKGKTLVDFPVKTALKAWKKALPDRFAV